MVRTMAVGVTLMAAVTKRSTNALCYHLNRTGCSVLIALLAKMLGNRVRLRLRLRANERSLLFL